MNEALQNLEIKVENGGSTPQGRVSAAEWNVLVAGVKALDLAGFDEAALRDYLDQYDYITRPELDKALEGIGGGSGSGIAYPLTWSGYSQGMWDGSAPANISIPSLLSQLTNDSDFITSDSVNSLLTDYLSKSGGVVSGNITAQKFIGALQGNADSATLWSYNSPWVQDFDALNYSNNGLYHFDGDYANLAGKPPHYSWNYTVLNIGYSSGRRQQLSIPYDASKMFIRRNVDNNWSDWREFAFVDTDSLTPSSGILTVNGNFLATGGLTAQNSSDRRLKENIRDFDAISILRGMGGVHAYEYVDTEVARDARYAGTHYGFIYQDVEGSKLERMCLKRDDGYGTLNYLDSNLISVVAGGVLSLDDRVKLLEEEINRLKTSLS